MIISMHIFRIFKSYSFISVNLKKNIRNINRSINSHFKGDSDLDLQNMFQNMPAFDLGNRFLVICSQNMVMNIMKTAEDLNLLKLDTQWIFVITGKH